MSGVWKNIPIFISSTFVDMHAERDHLRRFVFPELEERLRERRCYLEPIDLRWGVPLDATLRDERSLDLAVLRVCFQELGRSDYLVLGLLGDRYGWIPPADPLKEAAETAGFVQIPEGRSVTELELTYAVQKFPDHVLVYVRDPLPLARMPPHALAQYSDATSDDGAAKRSLLSQLKTILAEKLPQSVRPYRATWDERAEKLAALDAWGQQVIVDAWRMLDARTADLAVTNADPYAEQLWELEEFTAERLRIFVGRTELIDELVGRLLHEPTGEHGQVICITGAPGSGKSALFSALRAKLSTGPALVLEHAAGISKDSALPSVMRELDPLSRDLHGIASIGDRRRAGGGARRRAEKPSFQNAAGRGGEPAARRAAARFAGIARQSRCVPEDAVAAQPAAGQCRCRRHGLAGADRRFISR
jgi:hypothetical protein